MNEIIKAKHIQKVVQEVSIQKIMQDIVEAYQSDQLPWIVGFSGGKDSTALLQMVYYSIARLPICDRKKHIYVLASDTRVEMPIISERIRRELENIQLAAERDKLPITTHLVFPKLNDTFWVNLIGRGYPSPNSHFRWCTERLKIKPVSAFINKVVNDTGKVVILLGARKSESSTRAQTMQRYHIEGNRFRPHTNLKNAWIYTPIEALTANDVWIYLLQVPNPWNGDNRGLIKLYKNASGECPLVVDDSTPSCGQSRFGCWTCTVIDNDKSLKSLVCSGEEKLEPLLELRDYLSYIRNKEGARCDLRRNGQIPLRRGTEEIMVNTGPFTYNTRVDILKRVLEAQFISGITLIEGDELAIIQEIWIKEENSSLNKPDLPFDLVLTIWKYIYKDIPMPTNSNLYDYLNKEDQLLNSSCQKYGIPLEMMRRLRDIEEEYGHLKRRHGLPEEMRETIREYISSIE